MRRAARRAGHPLGPASSLAAWARPVAVSVLVTWVLWVAASSLPSGLAFAAAGLIVAVLLVRTVPDIVRAARLYRDLDAAIAAPTTARLDALLGATSPPLPYARHLAWVTRVLVASTRAQTLGRPEVAYELLTRLDARRLRADARVVYTQLRVAAAFATGRRDDARETLRVAPVSTGRPDFDAAIAYQRALLAALDGDVSDGRLAEAQAAKTRAEGWLGAAWASVEAHVLAARGDEPAARQVLEAILAADDRATLERVVRHAGPASTLAQRVLDAAPYR